jgi:hypothetical protein
LIDPQLRSERQTNLVDCLKNPGLLAKGILGAQQFLFQQTPRGHNLASVL